MARLSTFRLKLFAAIVATLCHVAACTDSFSDCESTRSCSPANDGTKDAGDGTLTDAAGSLGNIDGGDALAPLSCSEGFVDCNEDRRDGCEVELATDPDHCGACDRVCSSDGTMARACTDGVCHPVCDASHADCNGDGLDGCEVDLGSDADNCGECDRSCSTTNVSMRVCQAGACVPVCNGTYGDCRTPAAPTLDDGCETALTTADDCGACGHNCLGGGCTSQACQPLVLGTGRPAPKAVTVDDQWVHWIEGGVADGKVVRVSVMGSASGPTNLILNQASPTDIVNDGEYVYWSNSDPASASILRIRSGTADVTPVISGQGIGKPTAITVDDVNIYYVDASVFGIRKIQKEGGTPTPLSSPSDFITVDLASDATHVFFAAIVGGATPISGGNLTYFYSESGSTKVALDSNYVYFDTTIDQEPAIGRLPKLADTPRQTVTSLSSVGTLKAMTISGGKIYFATPTGIYVVDAAENVSSNRVTPQVNNPTSVEVHGGAIYWVNQGDPNGSTGSVLKLAL